MEENGKDREPGAGQLRNSGNKKERYGRWTSEGGLGEKLNPDLPGGGSVGPRCHRGAGSLDKKEVVIQQGPSSLDTACVKLVVEAAHVGVSKGGAMQEPRGPTVQLGKSGLIVTGVWGQGRWASAGKGVAPGWGRGRGALA